MRIHSVRFALCLAVLAACDSEDPRFIDAGAIDTPPDLTAPETMITASPAALTNVAMTSFAFTSDRSDATFRCSVDAAAPEPCTSPFMFTAAEGERTFSVFAVGGNGVADETPAEHDWRVDLTPPDTTILMGPAALDNSVDTELAFAANEPATYACTRDGGAAAPCTSPFAVTGLTDGAHVVTVRATDEAGNVEPDPAAHAWTVDTSAPDTVIDTGPTNGSFVASASATLTFSSPNAGAGAVFACSLDGAAFATCTSPRNLTGLAQGSHTFRVRVSDAVGNMDPTPAQRQWTVDTVAPTVMITGGPTGPTSDATPTFTFTTAGSPTATECRIDTGTFAPCSAMYTAATLGQGAHTFEVRVRDAAGNTGNATRAFTVDTVPPTVMITGGPTGATADSTPTFTFTTAGSPTTTTCAVGAQTGACTTTFTPTALADGSYTFTVTVADAAGNTGSATRSFSVDTGAPTVTITGGPTGPTNDTTPTFTFMTAGNPTTTTCTVGAQTGACNGSFTPTALANGSFTFTVTVADAAGNTGSATRSFSVDTVAPTVMITSGPTGPTSDSTPTFGFTTGGSPTTITCAVGAQSAACTTTYTPAALADGSHTFTVTVADAAGNTGSATRSFTVDTVGPTVTILRGPSPATSDTTPSFAFTTAGNPVTTTCTVGTQTAACTDSYTATALADGSYTFRVTVADAAGNTGSATLSFTVDTVAPNVDITGGPAGPTNDRTPTWTFVTTGSPTTTRCAVGTQNVACTSPFTATTLADGSYTLTITVSDAAGNSRSQSRSFSVDTVGPTVDIAGGPTQTVYSSTTTFRATASGHNVIECRNYPRNQPGGAYFPCTIPSYTYAVQFPVYPPNTIANWTFEMRARDNAGNTAVDTWNYSTGIII